MGRTPRTTSADSPARGGLAPGRTRTAGQTAAALVGELPTVVVVVLTVTVIVGTLSALLGWAPFSTRAASLTMLLLAIVLGVVVARWGLLGRQAVPELMPLAPAAVLSAFGAVLALGPGDGLGWFLGGDHVRHLLFAARVQAEGHLSYEGLAYPRGWHSLVAVLWSSTGASLDGSGLAHLIRIMAALAWLLPALVSAETGLLASALARRCGLGGRAPGVAGLMAGAGIGTPTLLANFQSLGFETSWVAALVLAVSARAVLDPGGGVRPVVLCAAGVVVMSHTWQLLLPATCLALLFVTWSVLSRRLDRSWALGAVWMVGALASLPGVLAVLNQVGLNHASDSDVHVPIPMLTLGAVLLCTGLLVVGRLDRGRDQGHRAWLPVMGAMILLPGLTALAIAARLHIPLTDYYPSKLAWHTAVLGLPAVAVAVVLGAGWLDGRQKPVGAVLRVAGGAMAATWCVGVMLTPVGASIGAWSTGHGRVISEAVTTHGAGRAQVAWLGDVGDDTIARVLLDFYRPSLPLGPQEPLDVARECALLAASADPAVVSNRDTARVVARYSCVPGVAVVSVADSP